MVDRISNEVISEYELRHMYIDKGMSLRKIAKFYDVSYSVVSRLIHLYRVETRTCSETLLINSLKLSKEELEGMYIIKKMTLTEIANEIEVSPSTVLRWVRLYEIEARTMSESVLGDSIKPSKEELEEMYIIEKMTPDEIANETRVSNTTILNWLRSYGIDMREPTGENHPNWQGGISFEPYCDKFNNQFREAVRIRDNYTCQLCGSEQNGRRLSVHHIHYNKADCWPDVVTLCCSCNTKVNANRDYWEQYFENQLSERGLTCWSILQEKF